MIFLQVFGQGWISSLVDGIQYQNLHFIDEKWGTPQRRSLAENKAPAHSLTLVT
jgi:hypothetical protein